MTKFLFIGEAHYTYSGKEVSARKQLPFVECRCGCYKQFNDEERNLIFKNFCDIQDHSLQNSYLQGCVQNVMAEKKRRRPRIDSPSVAARASFVYTITVGQKSIKVCQAAFVALHGIKVSRLKRKVLQFDKDIRDGRGKHNQHHQISNDIRDRIRQHIQLFPARESHYSRSQNTHRRYLDPSLSVAAMHQDFLKENVDLNGLVKYWLYYEIFNTEFNISFGYPRSDICDTCERLQAEIKAAETSEDTAAKKRLATEKELHLRKAEVFQVQLNEVTEQAKSNETIVVLAMDFQKNLPLPLTGVSQEYYKRQLWIHNFCIHECSEEKSTMFLYSENFAGKGPNDVLSCLQFYIKTLPAEVRRIDLFADNCFSQNKNRYIVAFFHTLVHNTRIKEVNIYYPLPGHSRMPCDRDFGRIEKRKRKKDKVSLPSQWVELVKSTDHQNPFAVVYVEHPLTDDLQGDGTPVVKVHDYKHAFDPMLRAPTGIGAVRGLKFLRGAAPKCRLSMTGGCEMDVVFMKRGQKIKSLINALNPLSLRKAYQSFLPIKAAKFTDVKELLRYVHLPEIVCFYNALRADSAVQAIESEDEYE